MANILEFIMMILFGLSWPLSILKSVRSRTAKGKSLLFLLFILCGYICGIVAKILTGNINYVISAYILNLLMVSADIVLYFRNSHLDKVKGESAHAARQISEGIKNN